MAGKIVRYALLIFVGNINYLIDTEINRNLMKKIDR